MQSFSYIIQDPEGIHARPAGVLVKKAMEFKSFITISKGEKKGDLKKIFSVMALGAKKNDEITIAIDGEDEENALFSLSELIKASL